ncbi:MAG TPA: hypothetical protein VF702_04195 [Allosphingosinicella sp.]
MTDNRSRSGRFKDAARELGCDDNSERIREGVAKRVRHEPAEKPE